MKKPNYEELYHKALAAGERMLEQACKIDKLADQNANTEEAIKQRIFASILRQWYTEMFN